MQDESGVDLNEVEAEGLCAFAAAVEDTLTLVLSHVAGPFRGPVLC